MTDPTTALREVLARMEETDNAERMPDDPALRCVFVDMRPEEFRAALAAAIAALSAPQPPAEEQADHCEDHKRHVWGCRPCEEAAGKFNEPAEEQPNGWLQAGGLLYRLTEGHRPENRDEIYVTMVHGSRDSAHCEARAAEILAMLQSQQQPPAEAQAQGGGEVVAWLGRNHRTGVPVMCVSNPSPSVMRDFAMRPLAYADSTPSAPVGVVGVRHEIQNALRELDAVMTAEDNTSDAVGCAELALQRALEALSQQPAAVDGAMVTAAQEQISEGLGAYLRKFTDSEAAMRAREYLHKMPSGEWEGMTRMLAQEALGAAIAAQPGGSDNDR